MTTNIYLADKAIIGIASLLCHCRRHQSGRLIPIVLIGCPVFHIVIDAVEIGPLSVQKALVLTVVLLLALS